MLFGRSGSTHPFRTLQANKQCDRLPERTGSEDALEIDACFLVELGKIRPASSANVMKFLSILMSHAELLVKDIDAPTASTIFSVAVLSD